MSLVSSPVVLQVLGDKIQSINKYELEFGMYPQSMPTEWTHARTLRPWQSVRLDLWRLVLSGL